MRTIVLLPDWDSTLFWRDAEGGGRIDEKTLPISAGLKRQLDDYYKHYSEIYYGDNRGAVPEMEKRLLDDTGLRIWQQLRIECKAIYGVLFHSDEFSCDFETPEDFIAARREALAHRIN